MAAGLGARRHTRRASSWVQFVRPNAEGREAGACRLTRVPMSPPTWSVWGVGGYPCRRARAGYQRGTSGGPRIQVIPPPRPRRGTNSRDRELAEAGRSVVVPFNRQYEAAGRAPTPPHGRASFSVGRPSALGSFSKDCLNRPPVLALKRVPRGSDHTAQALTFFFGAGRAMMHLEQSCLQLLGVFF